jgi:hypothetical protein
VNVTREDLEVGEIIIDFQCGPIVDIATTTRGDSLIWTDYELTSTARDGLNIGRSTLLDRFTKKERNPLPEGGEVVVIVILQFVALAAWFVWNAWQAI